MKIDIYNFKSAITAIEPELLSEAYATNAENLETTKGSIEALKQPESSSDIAVSAATSAITRLLFRDNANKLLQGTRNERWLSSPLAQDDFDRIYYTADGVAPQAGSYGTIDSVSFDLGLESPGSMTITDNGTGGDVQASSALFVEQSIWGELSEPSEATLPFQVTESGSIVLNMPIAPSSGHWTMRRVYIADFSGNYRYYATIPNTQATLTLPMPFEMDLLGEELDQLAEGSLNTKPRAGLKGLVSIPGGFFAGYDNNVIAFSKQYLPHAWPVNYEITINGNINAMEYAASGLVVLTDRQPYLISGSSPDAMYPVQLDITEPCIAPKAVVDMGSFVIYPSQDGLLAIAGSDNRNLIDGIIDKDEWRTYVSEDAVACLFNGKYWYFTATGGFVLDVNNGSFSKHTMQAQAVYADQLNDKIYFVTPSGNLNVYARFNSASQTFSWASKHFTLGQQTAISCGKVDCDQACSLSIQYITQNSVVKTWNVTAQPYKSFRLPAQKCDLIKATISGQGAVKRIQLASSMSELN